MRRHEGSSQEMAVRNETRAAPFIKIVPIHGATQGGRFHGFELGRDDPTFDLASGLALSFSMLKQGHRYLPSSSSVQFSDAFLLQIRGAHSVGIGRQF
jgi:hypothetical protein